MLDLNVKFMDLYKKVDRFIRDANGSAEGVSLYIDQMEQDYLSAPMYVDTWNDDSKMLKRLRWIRNQLSHEADFNSDICEEKDYEWLKSFYDRLLSASDPVTMLHKEKTEELHRREELKRWLAEERKRERELKILEQSKLQEQLIEQSKPEEQLPKQDDSPVLEPDDYDVEIEQVQFERVQYQPPKRKSFWQRIKEFFFG